MSKFDTFNIYDGVRYILNVKPFNIEIKTYYYKFEILIRFGSLFRTEKYYISLDEKYNERIMGTPKKFYLVSNNEPSKFHLLKYDRTGEIFSLKYIKDYCFGDLLAFHFKEPMFLGRNFNGKVFGFDNEKTIFKGQDLEIPIYNRDLMNTEDKIIKRKKLDEDIYKWKF